MSDYQAQEQAEAEKRNALRKILSKQAMERLARVKVVRPEVASQLESYLLSLYRAGKIRSEVSEEQMKTILETVAGSREFRIVRR